MNLKKGKFKIVEGTRVRMVSSKDTHIVEGAYGTVVNPGIRESEVRWDSMLAIRADYRYRNELGDLEVRDCEYSDDEITLLEE